MDKDYRNTKYCPSFDKIAEEKCNFLKVYRVEHPRKQDLYTDIANNNGKYKSLFLKAYNEKCAYCGVSLDLIPKSSFEIDHYIPKTSARFTGNAPIAGNIGNLVLSCHSCNHNKSNYEFPDHLIDTLHPDNLGIKKAFYRDELFYIKVADSQPVEATEFHEKLQLGRESCRIDYLLMNMIGLYNKVSDRPDIHNDLGKAIELLRKKRNQTV